MAAILVVRDGEEWLGSVLSTIAAQRYPALDLVVVDNASADGSAALLARRIPGDRLVSLPRNVGFARAVATAARHEAVADADMVLLLHDDLVLAPDAIARLVRALREDPSLGVVGPKLRDWSEEPILQEVGMAIDRFGRAESQLEPAELDQGQHDQQRPVLYVSTAGLLVRREVLDQLGGFDLRYPVFRDDLDFCWRAWLAGHRVEVVPSAVGFHIAAASRAARRLGRRPGHARYFAERHTLATLLKNYGTARLLWVLPVVVALALGKTAAFLATRRFSDAAAVVRAYLWNATQLPATLQRRRWVQSRRQVSDRGLAGLFAPGLPRARVYVEAVSSWLAGGTTRALMEESDRGTLLEEEPGSAVVRTLRRYPAACAGGALLVLYVIGLSTLLPGGQIVGGEIAPWPETARTFLRAYVSPWNGEPVGSGAFASPVQAVLGLVSTLGLGSAWLAQRLVVFGLLPLAWLFALRAGRLVTPRPTPRVLGATVYVLSPAVLGALGQGRFGTLVAATLLPGLTVVAVRATDPDTALGTAWRSAALLTLGLALTIAAEPGLAPLIAVGYLGLLLRLRRRGSGRPAIARLTMAGAAALGLLAPWLVDLLRVGTASTSAATPRVDLPLWRALAAAPEVLPTFAGAAGIRSAVTAGAIIAIGVLVGLRSRPTAVAGLVAAVALSGTGAWAAARLGVTWVWPPGLLVVGALALAALAVIAARTVEGGLGSYAFGLRQVAVAVAGVALAVGLAGGVLRLASGPWEGLERDPGLVPEFVAADVPRVGPYRVLLMTVNDGVVTWDIAPATGPSMVDFGTRAGSGVIDLIDRAVTGAVGGDLRAGARLGVANIRYVVVSSAQGSAEIVDALGRQPALEPLPSGGGRVFQVMSWLPRAVVLPPERGEALLATGDPGRTKVLEDQGLTRLRRDLYTSGVPRPGGGVLVVSEDSSPLWRASQHGRPLERRELDGVNAFTVPAEAGVVRARAAGGIGHRLVVGLQVLLLFAVISLALRPPGFTQGRAQRAVARGLPAGVAPGERRTDGNPREVAP